jgi:FdhE protein
LKRSLQERLLLLQRRVVRARSETPGLDEAAELVAAMIEVLIAESPTVELPSLDDATIEAKWAAGQPLLAGESLGIDSAAIQQTLLKLCAVAERHGRTKASQIRAALDAGLLAVDLLLAALLSGDDNGIAALAAGAHLDPALFSVLAHFALRPTLVTCAEAFSDTVSEQGRGWQRTTCPVCGGPPMLAEFRDLDQSRHLRCAYCATSWQYPRMQCARCGSDDFRRLSQLRLAGNARYHVDVCDACGGYLKGILAEEPLSTDLLPLEDLLTLALDGVTRQAGFQPATLLASTST